MSNVSTGLIGAVIGIGIGVFGGFTLAGNSEVESNTPIETKNIETTADDSAAAPDSSPELIQLKSDLAEQKNLLAAANESRDILAHSELLLRERLSEALDGPSKVKNDAVEVEPIELTTEQIETKRAEISTRLTAAWEAKRGRDVLDSLHEMEQLGPSVYAELMNEWVKVNKDRNAANVLGIDDYTWRREWGGSIALMKAAIDDSTTPRNYRYNAIGMLPERESTKSTAEYLSEKMLFERDEHAIMQFAEILGIINDPMAIDPLVQVVRKDFQLFYAKRRVVEALGKFDDPRTIAELNIIAANEDEHPAVIATAKSALLHISPPFTGLLVTSVSKGSVSEKAGLTTGVILTKMNGVLITSTQQMHSLPKGALTFEVYVDGSLKDIIVEAGALGLKYDFVTAK
ncbi:MAG: hypothetical protein V3V10_01740 [Planctomycetota bacterium]